MAATQLANCGNDRFATAVASCDRAGMSKIAIFAMVLGLAACGKKASGLVGEIDGYKAKMCKCADAACADKTWDEYKTWRDAKRKELKDNKPGDDVMKAAQESEKAMKVCRDTQRDKAGSAAGSGEMTPPTVPTPVVPEGSAAPAGSAAAPMGSAVAPTN